MNKSEDLKYSFRIKDAEAVLYIPLRKSPPILILKRNNEVLKKDFLDVKDLPDGSKLIELKKGNYLVYWGKRFLGVSIPPQIAKEYPTLIEFLFNEQKYNPNRLSSDSFFEFPLKYLENKSFKFVGNKEVTLLKKFLREIGVISEKRGKSRSKSQMVQSRDEFIIQEYVNAKKKRPLPIKLIKKKWEAHINTVYSGDYDKAEKNYCSEPTIRRVIQNFINKK